MNTTTTADRSRRFSLVLVGFLTAFGALPWLLWFRLWTYAWRARLYLGHWPCYGHPDPKALPEHFLPKTEMYDHIIPWGMFIVLVLVITVLISKLENYKTRMMFAAFLAVAGWITAFGLLFLDPGGFFEWIID
jgi:hypothetical protein